jgi:methylase of polypeptide subunit release factors
VECATENAARLGLSARFEVMVGDLFPPGRADLVVCNPPWIPEPPKNRMDRAVFDEDSKMLQGFLTGLPKHLTPTGQGLLILSDLPELLGLRAKGWLEAQVASAGLTITSTRGKAATHGKAQDKGDALHLARSKEITSLHTLAVR